MRAMLLPARVIFSETERAMSNSTEMPAMIPSSARARISSPFWVRATLKVA